MPPSCALLGGFAIGARVACYGNITRTRNVSKNMLVLALFLVMAALRSRCGHYIFALWFVSSIFFFYSSPNLSGRRLDVYHTFTHGVALVQI